MASTIIPQQVEIFRRDDGTAWNIFVEAGGIVKRPHLVRALKKAGANVCADPARAQVILIDSRSPQGRQFLRIWGNEVNKIILEYTWAEGSISAGRVFGSDDQWGGFMAFDDGLPISEEGAEGEVSEFNLPTPRITPVASELDQRHLATTQPPQPSLAASPGHIPLQFPFRFSHPASPPITPIRPMTNTPHFQPSRTHQIPPSSYTSSNLSTSLMASSDTAAVVWPSPQYLPTPSSSMVQTDASSPAIYTKRPMPTHSTSPGSSQTTSGLSIAQIAFSSTGISSMGPSSPYRSTAAPYKTSQSISSSSVAQVAPFASGMAMSRSVASHPPPPAPPGGSSPPPAAPVAPGTLFKSDEGQSCTFYVQTPWAERKTLLSLIKKNGGTIVPSLANADYVILYSHNKSSSFDKLLSFSFECGKLPVSAAFIYESVKEQELLDTAPYEFDPPRAAHRGRKRIKVEVDECPPPAKRVRQSPQVGFLSTQFAGTASQSAEKYERFIPSMWETVYPSR